MTIVYLDLEWVLTLEKGDMFADKVGIPNSKRMTRG